MFSSKRHTFSYKDCYSIHLCGFRRELINDCQYDMESYKGDRAVDSQSMAFDLFVTVVNISGD